MTNGYKRNITPMLLVGLIIHLCSCGAFAEKGGEMIDERNDINWQYISHEYVRERYGWSTDEYYLEIIDESETVLIVKVANKDDLSSIVPGAGKSFQVYIDKKAHKIVREVGYQ